MNSPETRPFQAETEQLLNIVIHSLYRDKEVFVRELISNAADACEKLRFLQTSGETVYESGVPPAISIVPDEKENTLTISDTGVGMTQAEVTENLGTIAHSGTKSFLEALKSSNQTDTANLIGQFGVGFYSAFMAAERVTVLTRSFRPEESGCRWTSTGATGYEMESAESLPRGTKIILHLREDARKFLKEFELERIIKRYSDFIQFPIQLNGKTLNTVQAIWSRNKTEIKEEEYKEFYRYISHDQEDPLFRLHFTADAPLAIQSLLYVPNRNPELMGMSRIESEVHLYCRKVLIESRPKGLLPEWLRFLKGAVDSEDLPLNISRENMQDSSLMQKLNKVLTGRFLKFLEEAAEKDPAAYDRFYSAFNRYLKEGVLVEFAQVGALGRLLRYESSEVEPGKKTSLAEYVKRMPADSKEIYYLQSPHREAAETSPYFEVFRARKHEVLFLYEPIDEFVMEHLHGFEDKTLVPIEKAELNIPDEAKQDQTLSTEQAEALAAWLKKSLGDRVAEVRVTKRLVDSPAAVFENDKLMTSSRRQLLRSMKSAPGVSPLRHDLEINPRHGMINQLEEVRQRDAPLATQIAEQILDNAKLAAGALDDTRPMLKRLNELLVKAMAAK
jgi:TNF receptor-associated protein 1